MLEPEVTKGLTAAAAITLGLVVFLVAVEVLYRRVSARLEERRRAGKTKVAVQRLELASGDRVAGVLSVAVRWTRNALVLVALYLYTPLVLSVFPFTEALAGPLFGYFLDPLQRIWDAFVAYLPNAIRIFVVILVARYSLKLLHLIFRAIEAGRIVIKGFHAEWAEPTYKLLRILTIVIVLVDVIPHLPLASSGFFQGVSLLVGAMVTLGSSSAVSNLVSGTVLIYTRGFQIGDYVEIGETFGEVVERSLLKTQVRTPLNEIVTIPNSRVLNASIVNYSTDARGRGLVLNTTVGIGYDVDWRRVHELLVEAARRTEHVLAEPAPYVIQKGLGDFAVSYDLRATTRRADIIPRIRSALESNVLDAFNEAGVEILSPRYAAVRDGNPSTVARRSGDEETAPDGSDSPRRP
jgi:small-conductance mechanosensitive channel